SGTHFDRWVFRIMRNTYLDKVRAKPRVRLESLENGASSGEAAGSREIVDVRGGADCDLLARTLDGPIQEALQALPSEFRIVVILADIQEMSYEEIANTLQCPIGTVRSRLHRGRTILRNRLSAFVRL